MGQANRALTTVTALKNLQKQEVIVRNSNCLPTLAKATTLVVGVAGMITQNSYSVTHIVISGKLKDARSIQKDQILHDIVRAIALSTRAMVVNETKGVGNTVEIGLMKFAEPFHSVQDYREKTESIALLPYSEEAMYTVGLYKFEDKYFVIMMGSPDVVMQRSAVTEKERLETLNVISKIGSIAVAFAQTELSNDNPIIQTLAQDKYSLVESFQTCELKLLGVALVHDPLKQGSADAINRCIKAGMKLVLITKYDQTFSQKIVNDISTTGVRVRPERLNGTNFSRYSEDEWNEHLSKQYIFICNGIPDNKRLLMTELQKREEMIVATGESIVDLIALTKADVSVALGAAQQVVKESADIALTNDSLAALVKATLEVKSIFN
jgi:Ca2+-transporting ATPase